MTSVRWEIYSKYDILRFYWFSFIRLYLFLLSWRGAYDDGRHGLSTLPIVSLLSALELFKLLSLDKEEIRCRDVIQTLEFVTCRRQPLCVVHHLYIVKALLFYAGRCETDLIIRQAVLIVRKQGKLFKKVPARYHAFVLYTLDDLFVDDEFRLDVLMRNDGGLSRYWDLLRAQLRPWLLFGQIVATNLSTCLAAGLTWLLRSELLCWSELLAKWGESLRRYNLLTCWWLFLIIIVVVIFSFLLMLNAILEQVMSLLILLLVLIV